MVLTQNKWHLRTGVSFTVDLPVIVGSVKWLPLGAGRDPAFRNWSFTYRYILSSILLKLFSSYRVNETP